MDIQTREQPKRGAKRPAQEASVAARNEAAERSDKRLRMKNLKGQVEDHLTPLLGSTSLSKEGEKYARNIKQEAALASITSGVRNTGISRPRPGSTGRRKKKQQPREDTPVFTGFKPPSFTIPETSGDGKMGMGMPRRKSRKSRRKSRKSRRKASRKKSRRKSKSRRKASRKKSRRKSKSLRKASRKKSRRKSKSRRKASRKKSKRRKSRRKSKSRRKASRKKSRRKSRRKVYG